MKLPKEVDDTDKIHFDNVPTLLEKSFGKPIGAGSFLTWHLVYGTPSLLLGERITKAMRIRRLKINFFPTTISASVPSSHNVLEVIVNYFLFGDMFSDPILLKTLNVIFFDRH
jgi:hypothetical protein